MKSWCEYLTALGSADAVYERAVALYGQAPAAWSAEDRNLLEMVSPQWMAMWALVRLERRGHPKCD